MDNSLKVTLEYLRQFKKLEKLHPGPIEGSCQFLSKTHKNSPHMLVMSCVHGDEVGSLPGLLKWMQKISQLELKVHITVALGNIPAIENQTRYIHYDLNRHFTWDLNKRKTDENEENTFEIFRAYELSDLLESCDYFIDLHQTIEPTKESFYVLSDSENNRMLAEFLGSAEKAILKKGAMDDIESATAFGFNRNKVGLTLELSQKGFKSEAESLTITSLNRALQFAKNFEKNIVKSFENSTKDSNKLKSKIKWLEVQNYIRFDGPLCRLTPGWENFSSVKKDQLIGKNNDGSDLLSPQDGYLLFPKYVERHPNGHPVKPLPRDIVAICGEEIT
jgi:succinylglutamate desuccinylase